MMQNQLNTQYNNIPAYGAYNQAQNNMSIPQGTAVNIQIFNPMATNGGFYGQNPCANYPCNYNNNFLSAQPAPMPAPSQYYNNQVQNPILYNNLNLDKASAGIAGQGSGLQEAPKTQEAPKEQKQTVALTDDYIKTLENYLNSPDKKVRLMGAKELFERFKEDETRKDDAALTALLNKSLQDPSDTVKFLALTAIDSGYATGNNETATILNQIQASDSNYGEDAALASQALLKMSGYKANMDAMNQNTPNTANKQNLNLEQNSSLQPLNTSQGLTQEPQIAQQINLNDTVPQSMPNLQNQSQMSKLPGDSGILQNPNLQGDLNMVKPINNNGNIA